MQNFAVQLSGVESLGFIFIFLDSIEVKSFVFGWNIRHRSFHSVIEVSWFLQLAKHQRWASGIVVLLIVIWKNVVIVSAFRQNFIQFPPVLSDWLCVLQSIAEVFSLALNFFVLILIEPLLFLKHEFSTRHVLYLLSHVDTEFTVLTKGDILICSQPLLGWRDVS